MAKARKTFGSTKHIVAVLPYLAPLSNDAVDQMEIEFSLQDFPERILVLEERFFDWMMEIKEDYPSHVTEAIYYEVMFIERYYSTGKCKYLDYQPLSVEGYLAMSSIDDRKALHVMLSEEAVEARWLEDNRWHHAPQVEEPVMPEDQIDWAADMLHFQNEGRIDNDAPSLEEEIVQTMPLRGLKCSGRHALLEWC